MPVSITKEGWLQLYTQQRRPNGALSRMFTVKPGGIYSGTKIAVDVERYGEAVATTVTTCTGPNMNDVSQFTTKEFEPPAYGEAFPTDVCELLNRMAGVDPFSAAYANDAAQLMAIIAKRFILIDDKISRAVELQASQILQTGKLLLVNKSGDTTYELDFKPKATHFPAAAIDWDQAGATPLADMAALMDVIRTDGKIDCNQAWMGALSLKNFLANDEVKAVLDNRRMELGQIAPRFVDSGVTYYGAVWVGTYKVDLFAYPETYDDPQTGLPVKYLLDNSVVLTSDKTRLDMTSARVPLPLGPDPRVAGLMPSRMSSRTVGASFDVTPNLYPTANGKQIMGELESRPLLIPVQIDGFGCLTTG